MGDPEQSRSKNERSGLEQDPTTTRPRPDQDPTTTRPATRNHESRLIQLPLFVSSSRQRRCIDTWAAYTSACGRLRATDLSLAYQASNFSLRVVGHSISVARISRLMRFHVQ